MSSQDPSLLDRLFDFATGVGTTYLDYKWGADQRKVEAEAAAFAQQRADQVQAYSLYGPNGSWGNPGSQMAQWAIPAAVIIIGGAVVWRVLK